MLVMDKGGIVMSVKYMLEFLFGKTRRSEHLRRKAEEFIRTLKEKGFVSVKEAKQIIGGTKTYFKITKKLRKVGLISLSKDVEGNFNYSLTLDAYKFFIKRHLIEEVEEVLK